MKVNYPIVNAHGHILPNPNQIPASIKKAGYFDILGSQGSQFMQQSFLDQKAPWKRPISHETFFLEPYLEWAEKNYIAHTAMLTLSQLYCNTVSNDRATLDIIKFQNDFHLEIQNKYPKHLSCGFVVQPRLLEESMEEIELRRLQGLKFLCLPTHYRRNDGSWISCTDQNCKKIFECANQSGLPINIHPYDYEFLYNIADIDTNWSGHKSPMPSLTAHFYERLVTQGLHKKYPNVKFYLSHGNVVGLATIGRQEQAYKARPDLRNEFSESPLEALQSTNIFYDTIVHDPDLIWLMKKKLDGTRQLIHGIDTPYPLGDGINYLNDGIYPGYTLDKSQELGYINIWEKVSIFRSNFFSWLYGNDHSAMILREKIEEEIFK